MKTWIVEAETLSNTNKNLYIFLDEVNTSPDIGWFNEIICDHTIDGEELPNNMKIIAACNPYRKRPNSKHIDSTDELSKYMYRVYTLTPTMKEYVWEFGSLSPLDEKQYICEMIAALSQYSKHFDTIKFHKDLGSNSCKKMLIRSNIRSSMTMKVKKLISSHACILINIKIKSAKTHLGI